MHIISAAVPAPWWTPLSYVSETALAEGLRIAVPLGSSGRVALTLPDSCGSEESSRRLKKICSVIDEKPPLPERLELSAPESLRDHARISDFVLTFISAL